MGDSNNDEKDYKSELDSYKMENDKLRRDNDKIIMDYELKIQNLRNETENKTLAYDELKTNFNELNEKYQFSCKEKIELNQSLQNISNQKMDFVKKYDKLEFEHVSLVQSISHREDELVYCKKEIKKLKDVLSNYKDEEIQIKLREKDIDYKCKEYEDCKRLNKERNDALLEEVKHLTNKFKDANEEIFQLKSNFNKTIYELNLDLDSKRLEIRSLKKSNEKLKETIDNLDKINDEKSVSLRSAVENQTNIDNLLRNELHVQQSIAELHKEERDECLIREKKLIEAFNEIQDTLRESNDYGEQMKQEYEGKLKQFSDKINELHHQVDAKNQELSDANDLIEKFRVKSMSEEDLKSMNPATSAAIGALKRGYSITQIYSEYLQVTNEVSELKTENNRLNEYVKSLFDEVENNASMGKRNKGEVVNLELALSTVSKRYDETLVDLLKAQQELEEYKTKYTDIEKQLKIDQQMNRDMGAQICSLLVELETMKGTVIRGAHTFGRKEGQTLLHNQMQLSKQSINSMAVASSAQRVITTHMVNFKDIYELQQKNQLLLLQIRELSADQEAMEKEIKNSGLQSLTQSYTKSMQRIEELSEKVKKIKHLEKIIESQRHLIQALSGIVETSNNPLKSTDLAVQLRKNDLTSIDNATKSVMAISNTHSNVNNSALMNIEIENQCELNNQLKEKYELQVSTLKDEISDLYKTQDELRMNYNDKITLLNDQLNDNKINTANLISKLSQSQDRNNSLEQNLINRQLEQDDIQQELTELQIQLQQKKDELNSIKSQMTTTESRLKEAEVTVRHLTNSSSQFEILREQILNERNEKHNLMTMTNNLASQIQELQASINARKQNINDELSADQEIHYKSEIRSLNLALKNEASKYQTACDIWQAKNNELSSRIESLTHQINTLSKKNTNINDEDDNMQEVSEKSPGKDKSDFEKNIEELTVQNRGLVGQVQTLKKLLKESEEKLIENSEIIEQMIKEFEIKINNEKAKNTEQQDILKSVQSCYETLTEDYDKLKQELNSNIQQLSESISVKDSRLSDLSAELAKSHEIEVQLKKDNERLRLSCKEYSQNYHKQLIFHAQDSDELKKTMDALRKYQKQDQELSDKLKVLEIGNAAMKENLENKEKDWATEKEALVAQLNDLDKDKEGLNMRLVELNNTVVNLKKLLDPSLQEDIDKSVIQNECDWNEVVKYLRQEKDNAEKAKNSMEFEIQTMKLLMHEMEDKNSILQATLDEERQFKLLETENNRKHGDVMHELEQLQMIKESNTKLREDRTRLSEKLEEKTSMVNELKLKIEPLKEKVKLIDREIESIKIENTCLDKERDLWRKRSSDLIERLNQVNPEDYKKLCVEKDEIEGKLFETEAIKFNQISTIKSLEDNIKTLEENIAGLTEQINELRSSNEDNLAIIQSRDTVITQLKEIGRKYKTETEALKKKIDDSVNEKEDQDTKINQLQRENEELKQQTITQKSIAESTSAAVIENTDQLKKFVNDLSQLVQTRATTEAVFAEVNRLNNQQNDKEEIQQKLEEIQLRKNMMENRIAQLSQENDKLRHQTVSNTSMSKMVEEDNEEINMSIDSSNLISISNPIVSITNVTPVARVTASIQPSIVKAQPLMSTAASTSATTSTATIPAISLALPRQTVEIRPIPATIVPVEQNTLDTNTTPIVTPVSSTATTVTTSLPANVMQALSSATVIFPGSSIGTSTSSVSNTLFNNQQRSNKRNIAQVDCSEYPQPSTSSAIIEDNIYPETQNKKPRLTVTNTRTQLFSPSIPTVSTNIFASKPEVIVQNPIVRQNISTSEHHVTHNVIQQESTEVQNATQDINQESDTLAETGSNDIMDADNELDEYDEEGVAFGEDEDEYDEDDVQLDDDEDEDEEEDDKDDDEEDPETTVIELSSSDGEDDGGDEDDDEDDDDDDNDENTHEDNGEDEEDNDKEEDCKESNTDNEDNEANKNEEVTRSTMDSQEDIELAKKKIQPIVWHDSNSSATTSNIAATSSQSASNSGITNPIVIAGPSHQDDQSHPSTIYHQAIPVLQADNSVKMQSGVFHLNRQPISQQRRMMNPHHPSMMQHRLPMRRNYFASPSGSAVPLPQRRAIRSKPYRPYPRR